MTHGISSADGGSRKKGRVLLGVAAFAVIIALAGVVAAVVFSGGVDGVMSMVAGSLPRPSKAPASAPAQVATATPVANDFARRMYVEQLESHEVIDRMADGEVSSIVVRKVQTEDDTAYLDIMAAFTDGTYADGIMILQSVDGAWYLFNLTGMRRAAPGGFSSSVRDAESTEGSETPEAQLDSLGMSTFDDGVIDTLSSEQAAHQEVLTKILKGTYNAIELKKPSKGAGTITVPVILTGPDVKGVEGSVTMIQKEIDGSTRTFISTMQ